MKTKTGSDTPTLTATATTTMSTTPDAPDGDLNAVVDAAVSEVWYLKPITFGGRHTRIITQNFNGSVSTGYAVSIQVIECLTSLPQPMLIYSHL